MKTLSRVLIADRQTRFLGPERSKQLVDSAL